MTTQEHADLAAIRAAISEGETVPVQTAKGVLLITLHPPDADAVPRVRALLPDGDTDDKAAGFPVAVQAVRECIPGLTEREAHDLLLIAGGELSELGRVAMRLCGTPLAGDDDPGDEPDRPTS